MSAAQLQPQLLILVMHADQERGLRRRLRRFNTTVHLVSSVVPLMVSTPSLPSAAHEIADSIFLTDEEAERFLQKFPLVHILE